MNNHEQCVHQLSKVLAESYSLYLLTQNFHWNVTGPHFGSLHILFMEQYSELALAIDEIAERIRALGHFAPGSYQEFTRLSAISFPDQTPKAEKMVELLLQAQETLIRTLKSALESAQTVQDEPSIDLLIGRIKIHEKTTWMLKSILA